jgi:sn-glycerol 3-phosphate transport system permease protein
MSNRLNRPGALPSALTYLWFGIAGVVLLFPVLLTVVGGFLPSSSLLHQPPQPFGGDWTAESYVEAWNQPVVPLAPAFANSLLVGIAIMLGHLVTSCLAAYALAFLRTPLRKPLFWLFLATITVPYESIVVPNTLFIRARSW